MKLTQGYRKDRAMNGSGCRETTLPGLRQTGLKNSHDENHPHVPYRAEAVKEEHIPDLAETRSSIPSGIVPGGDT
jgi:hypothetical protein